MADERKFFTKTARRPAYKEGFVYTLSTPLSGSLNGTKVTLQPGTVITLVRREDYYGALDNDTEYTGSRLLWQY